MKDCIRPDVKCDGRYIPGPNMRPLCNVANGVELCRIHGPMKQGIGFVSNSNLGRHIREN